MGKSSKKLGVEISKASSLVPPAIAAKKGKRGAEETPDEQASFKKLKKDKVQVDQKKRKAKKLKKMLREFSREKKDDAKSLDFEKEETDNSTKDFLLDDAKNKEVCELFEKEPKTVAKQNEESGTKRLFVGNLPSEVTKDHLLEFFRKAGEVTEIRLAANEDGSFRGFGHVEFAMGADAQKALKMNGGMLLGRPIIIDLAHERGSNILHEGMKNGPFKIGVRDEGYSVFVKGFAKSIEEEKIRNLLEKHFGSCGEVIRVSIPHDKSTNRSKGFAYVIFNEQTSTSNALQLNGTELANCTLTVEIPSGGRGREGRSVGRDGGRDGDGTRYGNGGRGRGASYNRNGATANKGKKTTFGYND